MTKECTIPSAPTPGLRERAEAAVRAEEEKHRAALLRESEERLRLAIDGAGMGTWDVDVKTGATVWSPQHYQILGYEPNLEPPSWEMWRSRVHPDDLARVMAARQSALETRGLYNPEHRIMRADTGEIRWVAPIARYVYNDAGEAVRFLGVNFDITERKRAEAALRESEERFRATFENAAVGIAHTTLDGRYRLVNDRFCQIVGYSREQLLASTFQDVTHPDDLSANLALLQRALAEEIKSYEMEKRYIRKDGSIVWVALTVSLKREARTQAPLYFISVVQDISKRRQTEDALRDSEDRLQHALSAGALGTWERDVRTGEIEWDERTCQMYGIEGGAKIDLSVLYSHVHADDLPALKNAIEQTAVTGKPYHCDFRFVRPDGKTVWVQGRGGLRRDESGAPTHIVGVNFDITERKRAEDALRQSEERYRALVETGTSVILGLTPDHRIFEWNRAAEHIYGWSRAEALGKNYLTTFLPAEIRQDVAADISRVLAGHPSDAYENEVIHRDGGRCTLVWNVCRLLDGQGLVAGIMAIGQDITERKRVENELRQLTADLERRVEARTAELSASRQQLRALAERLHALQEAERAELARELHDQFGAAMTALKVDLHWLMARLPKTGNGLEKKTRSMSALIDETVESIRRTATLLRPRLLDDFGLVAAIEWQTKEFERRTGIRCVTSLPEEVDLDHGRSTALFRILQEALTNVVRHAKATHVGVSLRQDNGNVTLEVKDNGVGIRPENISSAKSFGLLGMLERAYAFGGHVRFEGRRHQGTTVAIELPFANIVQGSKLTAQE